MITTNQIAFLNASHRALLVGLRRTGDQEISRLSIHKFVHAARLPSCPEIDSFDFFGDIVEGLNESGLLEYGGFNRSSGMVTRVRLSHRGREEARYW